MALLDEALLNGGVRYNGGQNAPIGSFWNPRTNCIYQQLTDGNLPACGTFIQVTTVGNSSLTNCATAINGLVSGLNYSATSLHAYAAATDLAPFPGQAVNDG